MINPSATGWIDKFFIDQKSLTNPVIENPDFFYSKVRDTGFIYGYIISLQTPVFIDNKGWTEDEMTKVALLNTLFGVFKTTTLENNPEKYTSNPMTPATKPVKK